MKKIPTVFVRNEDTNRKHVRNEVMPGCEWVLAGVGVATRKYDGTCVLFDNEGVWWFRREMKPGKEPPPGWVPADEVDSTTGKQVGWEPAGASSFYKHLLDAVDSLVDEDLYDDGITYELCGPSINGNPEGFERHVLVRHATAQRLPDAPRGFYGLRNWLLAHTYEGIVWQHPDGRMAKLKNETLVPELAIQGETLA